MQGVVATCQDPPFNSQLECSLRQLRGQMAISAENNENNVLGMAKQMLYFNKSYGWQESFARLEVVTADILQQVAKEVFDPDNLYMLSYE